MPFNNLCSAYPLLLCRQREYLGFPGQLPLMQSRGERRGSSSNRSSGDHSSGESPSLKKGPWTVEEDEKLRAYVRRHGDKNWNSVRGCIGISRGGKSCRLRWRNHLRPGLKGERLQPHEERLIIQQHRILGNRWSRIAAMLPGRTDNEIKNFWNIRRKRLMRARLPLYPPPEALAWYPQPREDASKGTVEDVGRDICTTYGPSNGKVASSMAPGESGFPLLNWSCSAVDIGDLVPVKAHVSPAVTDGDHSCLEKAVGPMVNGVGPQNGIMAFCDSSPNAISFRSQLSCGTGTGYNASNASNNYLTTIRLDKGCPHLKVELHSVQRHECSDSSSVTSETSNFFCNMPASNEGGSLLDVVYHPQNQAHGLSTTLLMEQSLAVPMGFSVGTSSPSAKDVTQTGNYNPPSPQLDGCSLVPIEEDLRSGSVQSDFPLSSLYGGSYLSVELPSGIFENNAWSIMVPYHEEGTSNLVALDVAGGGNNGNGNGPCFCMWSSMPGLSSSTE